MDRLASCYFCGVAVEAPLEEYPVVPRDLRPSVEDQSTVVLCPECRRKLSTIVERVVAATSDPAQTELGESVGTGTGDGQQQAGSEQTPTEALERFDDERPNLVDFGASHERDEEMVAREAAHESPVDGDETEETEPEESVGASDATEETAVSGTDANDAGDSVDTSGTDASDAIGRTDSIDTDDVDTSDREPNDTDDDGGDNAAVDRDFSKSSYNKVVRLLQNREFPVEEDEITTVAGSAYGIGRREANEVIDALIERGILERDGSRLRRADD